MKPSGIGGQAVLEGIMMRNRDRYAVAVRKPDGSVAVDFHIDEIPAWRKTVNKIPIVRGVVSFVLSLVVGMQTLTYSASFYEDEEEPKREEKKNKEEGTKEQKVPEKEPGEGGTAKSAEKAKSADKGESGGEAGDAFTPLEMGLTVALAIVLAVGLFVLLPYGLSLLFRRFITNITLLSLLEGVFRLIIFLAYVWAITLMEDIKRTYMYHGAEHKCINCIEHGKPLTVENVRESSRFHKRCGTSFLLVVMVISIVIFSLIRAQSPVLRLVYRLLLIPVVAGVSYEFLQWAGRSENAVVNVLSKPGLCLQRLTTKEPDDDMISVAITAVERVFDWEAFLEGKDAEDCFPTFRCEERRAIKKLEEAGVPDAAHDARELMLITTGMDLTEYLLHIEDQIPAKITSLYRKRVARREKRVPLQHITGTQAFYGLDFKVNKDVLIPRPETELLVEEAAAFCRALAERQGPETEARTAEETPAPEIAGETEADERTDRYIGASGQADGKIRVLDLGTGSGCILISLLHECPDVQGTGTDISSAAIAVARKNALRAGVRAGWKKGDLFDAAEGYYDLIVSNPPYIKEAELADLEPEVRDHDPREALSGGADGLDFYRRIAAQAPDYLKDGGQLLLEIGADQAADVSRMLSETGFAQIAVKKDLSGLDRMVSAVWIGGKKEEDV